MFALLFSLAILPILPTLKKFLDRKDVNIFDITLLFSEMYFWAIPVKDFLVNHVHPEYVYHDETAIAVCLYMYGLAILALIFSRMKNSPLLVTKWLEKLNRIEVKNSFQWFALIYIAYMLFQITNYAALDDENFEGNNNFFYGENANIIMKLILVPFREFFPAIFIVLWTNKPKDNFYSKLRFVNLLLMLVSLLLGNKGFMMFNFVFLALYLYAHNRTKLSRKKILFYAATIICTLSLVFPISQSFRYYKQDVVRNTSNHSFITVAKGFLEDGISTDLQKRVDDYEKGRSLNIYDATDFAAARTNFRGYGYMSWIIFKYVIPQRMGSDGNIMAVLMLGGGDVGESTLAWFVLDYGYIIGPIVAVLYFLFLYSLYYYFGMFFYRWVKNPVYQLVIYTIILRIAVGIERNPSTDIKALYNTYYLIIIFVWVILAYYSKKPRYKIRYNNDRKVFEN